ncbi:MAG: aspartate/tyrosine/aromatic aminotransferase [Rhodobacteraceae bacterium]|nr:aspartate/tyrosine/aromatic aminotransferase [Paracoccaceae bacterium]
MFAKIAPPEGDRLLALMSRFRADPRAHKIDLGIGIYMDAAGRSPVLAAVKEAERRIWENETTKAYVGALGHPTFNGAAETLVLGDHPARAEGRVRTVQTPGGTAALRVAGDLIAGQFPGTTVWMSDPTWINHAPGQRAAGNAVRQYPYIRATDRGLDADGMMAVLEAAAPGDVVLVQAACHNPTGVDLAQADWTALADLCQRKGLLPLVDNAYQGFAAGREEDAAGLRMLAGRVPSMIVTTSFSKTFGLYRERVGAVTLIGETPDAVGRAEAALAAVIRANYSMPPHHGAAVVAVICLDDTLRHVWETELEAMRTRLLAMRGALAAALAARGADGGYLTRQRGMFSYTCLGEKRVARLRERHAVYLTDDGRMNIAGLNDGNLERVAEALAEVAET